MSDTPLFEWFRPLYGEQSPVPAPAPPDLEPCAFGPGCLPGGRRQQEPRAGELGGIRLTAACTRAYAARSEGGPPLQPLRETGTYDAFVLGSAIHRSGWLPMANAYVHRNSDLHLDRKDSDAWAECIARHLSPAG